MLVGKGDSNLHAFQQMVLSHARLPILALPDRKLPNKIAFYRTGLKLSSNFTGLASGISRTYAILNEQANKPAEGGNILALTGGSTLDNGFFSTDDGVIHSKGGLKKIGKESNHGLEHLLTEEI
jgi:hypothetical protein